MGKSQKLHANRLHFLYLLFQVTIAVLNSVFHVPSSISFKLKVFFYEKCYWNSWEFYYCNCWNVFRWCDQNADSFKLTWHITLRSVFQFSMRHGILVYKRIWTAPSRISSIRLGFVKGVRHANVYILHFKNINPTPLFFEIVFVTIQV